MLNNDAFKQFMSAGYAEDEEEVASGPGAFNPPKPRPVPKISSEFGTFEKHTKGFGSKYLAKFGGSLRLGKYEQGIAEPIAVQVRPQRAGLAFGGFKEAANLPQNKEAAKDYAEASSEEGESEEEDLDWRVDAHPKAKKGKKKKTKKVFKTAGELFEEARDIEKPALPRVSSIIDMSGPQVKVITNLEELAGRDKGKKGGETEEEKQERLQKAAEREKKRVGRELLHNLELLVNLAEVDLTKVGKEIGELERTIQDKKAHAQSKFERGARAKEELAHLESISYIITRSEERVKDILNGDEGRVLTLGESAELLIEVAGCVDAMRKEYPVEFMLHKLYKVAGVMLGDSIAHQAKAWRPFSKSPKQAEEGDPLLSNLQHYLALAHRIDEDVLHLSQLPGQSFGYDTMTKQDTTETMVHQRILEVLFPIVRTGLLQQWNVRRPDVAISIIKGLDGIVPRSQLSNLLNMCVWPKLEYEISHWNPLEDTVPIHKWTHPWLPFIGDQLATTFPSIRFKLSKALSGWDAKDSSAYIILAPWQGVMDDRGLQQLLLRSIMPKLVKELREMKIDPSNQVRCSLHCVKCSAWLMWCCRASCRSCLHSML